VNSCLDRTSHSRVEKNASAAALSKHYPANWPGLRALAG
jgi:hypothetical protein